MGEMAIPSRDERDQLVQLCHAIVDAVTNDEPIYEVAGFSLKTAGDPLYIAREADDLIARLAQLALIYLERLTFIAHMTMTGCQTALDKSPELRLAILREVRAAALNGEFPDWWPDFKKELDCG